MSNPSTSIDETMQMAFRHQQAGRLADAEKLLSQILSRKPNHGDALHMFGLLAAQSGRMDEAVRSLRQAIAAEPSKAGYYCNLGRILSEMRKPDEAVAACREAIRLRPEFPEAFNNLGIALKAQGKSDQAVTAYRSALRLRPNFPEACNNLANALNDQGKFDEAIAACREALRLKPDYPAAFNSLGTALSGKQQHQQAAAAFQESVRLNPNSTDAYSNLSIALRSLGKMQESIDACYTSLRLRPNYPAAYNNLGNALNDQGKPDEAIEAYQQALRIWPNYPEAHTNLGQTFLNQNRLDEAIEIFTKLTALTPRAAWAHCHLANALSRKGRFHEALTSYRRAAEFQPDLAAAHNGIGNMLRTKDQLGDAIASYMTAIRLKPDFISAYYNLGQAYRTAGRFEEALVAYTHALKPVDDADNIELLGKIAEILAELQRFSEARAAHARLAALAPNDAVTFEVMGDIMLREHDAPGAAEQFRRAVAINPNLDTAWKGLGSALQSQGNFDEAAQCFRKVLELCPDEAVGQIYRHLFDTGKIDANPADIERLTACLNATNSPATSRIAAGFALGKLLDDAQRYDEAFARYDAANALVKQMQAAVGEQYVPTRFHEQVREMVNIFTPDFFRQRKDWGNPSDIPVFIVGMPRSGTTLVHQIAASHPQVHGAGELNDIAEIIKNLGGTSVRSSAMGWTADGINRESARHLQELQSYDPAALRVLDKMPSNLHWLGLICALYPKARVIFCLREPRDLSLSCYFQWFSKGNTFAYDLAHCGHEYIATEDMMAHWRKVLPLPILEIQYEDLVADLETHSRRIIDFLGLPWDRACLEFHRAQTTVLTASSWQVRQPIYQSSVGRWRHYEKHLGPLMDVLPNHPF